MASNRHAIVVLQGGLGNQLFQFCAGETIARRSGYPVFYDCDMSFRADPFGRRFELPHLIPPARRLPEGSNKGWPLIAHIHASAEKRIMHRRGYSSLPLAVMLSSVRWWPHPRVVCRSYFQSIEYIAPETVELMRGAMNPPPDGSSPEIAVHFRLTLDRDAAGKMVRSHAGTVLPPSYYRECLRQARARFAPARFRVFTDTGEIPAGVFEPGDEVMADDSGSTGAWDLLCRMANCRRFILANSTLGWWAAFLSRSPDKLVMAPQNWLFGSGRPPQQGIFPSEWRRVPVD